MNNFLKKNQKKLLAVFSAGLMIAFALPSAVSNVSKSRDVVTGYAGKQKVTSRDVQGALEQWLLLKRTVFARDRDGSQQRQMSVVDAVFSPEISAAIDHNTEMYYLLLQEATDMGVTVGRDEIESVLANSVVSQDDGQGSYPEREREALRGLMSIRNAAQRAAEGLKLSRPLRDHGVAEQQQISVNLVQFNARDYLARLPEWSELEKLAKVDAQYKAYANLEPTTQPSNEFGFGYRVPNQFRIQYIELPQEEIRKAAAAKITEIEARKYHLQNPELFPATQPNSVGMAALKALPLPPTVAAPGVATTAPSIPSFLTIGSPKHFDEYREEIYKKLTDKGTFELTQKIITDINVQMSSDYAAFKGAIGPDVPVTATTLPATAASAALKTTFGVPYDSYEYLQKLAQHIQNKYGVLPPTYEDKGLRTARQLPEISGIGKASVQGFDIRSLITMLQRMGSPNEQQFQQIQQMAAIASFPVYASNLFEPFASPQIRPIARRWGLRMLSLLEPSPILEDRGTTPGSERDFIFRVAEAQLAHPANRNDVFEQVVADARLAEAYQLAQKDAALLITSAQQIHLAPAAGLSGRLVITTDAFGHESREINNFKLPNPQAASTLIQSAFNLLARGDGVNDHPVGVIDVRPAAAVFVAELNQIRPPWTPDTLPEFQAKVALDVEQKLVQEYTKGWFSYPQIIARTHYKPVETTKKQSSPEPEQQPDDNPLR